MCRGMHVQSHASYAEAWSIDFYLANSEEELLKVVARLEKLEKDTIKGKKD